MAARTAAQAPAEPTDAAQPENDPSERTRQAQELFARSAKLFTDGEFGLAAGLLREAYDLNPEPVLLYNLGRALEGLGDVQGAAQAYRDYLNEAGDVRDRKAVQARIESLDRLARQTEGRDVKEALERLNRLVAARDEGGLRTMQQAVAPPPPKHSVNWIPWSITGAGVVTTAIGFVLSRIAHGRASDANASTINQVNSKILRDDAERLNTIGNITMIAGGVIIAGGATWGVIDLLGLPRSKTETRVGLGPGGFTVSGRF